jgi:hypothetical protein
MVFSLNRLIPRDAMADREGSAPETRWRRVLGATALLFHSREHNFGLALRPARCKFAKSGAKLFQQGINFEAPGAARRARMLFGTTSRGRGAVRQRVN